MASVISHAIAAVGISTCFCRPETPKYVWATGIVASMLPDADIIGFHFGIRYGDLLGHRGFTHSLFFGVLVATAALAVSARKRVAGLSPLGIWSYVFLCVASHAFLDAMTDGGLGVAFFSPVDVGRYFLPWRPIKVSPIGVGQFLGSRGIAILRNEILWIWIPTLAFVCVALLVRKARGSASFK